MIPFGDCIDVLDLAGGLVRSNRCLGAGRIGVLFSDAAGGTIEDNEIIGAPVAGSVDGELPETVTVGVNDTACSLNDQIMTNGGFPKPRPPGRPESP